MSNMDLKPEHTQKYRDYYRDLPNEFLPLDVFKSPDVSPSPARVPTILNGGPNSKPTEKTYAHGKHGTPSP